MSLYSSLIFILAFTGAAIAQESCKPSSHKNASAKTLLRSIYAAEVTYFIDYQNFSEKFNEIGFVIEDNESCDYQKWDINIRSYGSNGFVAYAKSTITGEEWSINHLQELIQESTGLK